MTQHNCRFCDIWAQKYAHPTFDKPFLTGKGYLSIVSIGAFIDGWSLIVPKEHIYSLRTHYDKSTFWNYVSLTAKHIQKVYGKRLIAFEHGANSCDSKTSCGTHHAHLHLVPFDTSLFPELEADRKWMKVSADKVSELVGESEYLLYSDLEYTGDFPSVYIHILEKEESQFFRKFLAEKLGVEDYSYKTAPHLLQTEKSYEDLK